MQRRSRLLLELEKKFQGRNHANLLNLCRSNQNREVSSKTVDSQLKTLACSQIMNLSSTESTFGDMQTQICCLPDANIDVVAHQ